MPTTWADHGYLVESKTVEGKLWGLARIHAHRNGVKPTEAVLGMAHYRSLVAEMRAMMGQPTISTVAQVAGLRLMRSPHENTLEVR